MKKERALGLVVGIIMLHGLYLLEYNLLLALFGISMVMQLGLSFLVQYTYSKSTDIKIWSKGQEKYYMMFPMYPVIHRLYYNYIVPKDKKMVPDRSGYNWTRSVKKNYKILS